MFDSFFRRRPAAAKIEVALWEWNLDTVFFELGFERPEVGGSGAGRTFRTLSIDPHEQQEIQTAVTKFHQPDVGIPTFRMGQRIRDRRCGLQCRLS